MQSTQHPCIWTQEHRFGSFAPVRGAQDALDRNVSLKRGPSKAGKAAPACAARWILNGRAYFAAIAEAMQAAQSAIFITAWFLSPEVLLLRRADGEDVDVSLEDVLRQAVAHT
jgi:phosphatidylserine/phosphatidylglycerophosphate/cardiolipin synthase-like enzyme